MRRRSLLAALGGTLCLAGCLGGDEPGEATSESPETEEGGSSTTDAPTTTERTATGPTDPATEITPSLVESSFTSTEMCPGPGTATVDTEGTVVAVDGCVRGANGCTVAVLDAVLFETGANELTVRVTTADNSGAGTACTQAIVHLGYAVEVAFDGGLPRRVTVVHDDADGRHTVLDRTFDG